MCYRHHEIPTILACLHVNLIITHFLSVCTFLCVMAIDAECIFAIFYIFEAQLKHLWETNTHKEEIKTTSK